MAEQTDTTLQGTVERVSFVNEESQYTVARLVLPGQPGSITIVGNLPSLTPGETLRVHGAWTHHRKYGPQFAVERFESVVPATLAGIQRYLGSGLIRGIGPVFAQRLVERFGLETLRVIEEAPERLAEVGGIGPLRRGRIVRAWAEQREIREVMLFLQGHGVSPAYGVKIFRAYGQAAIATVRANPYRLAQDIFGIGFKVADRIARELGIPEDAPQRAEAGLLYVLQQRVETGDVYVPEGMLLEEAASSLGIPAPRLGPALAELVRAGRVVLEGTGETDRGVYPAALHGAEVEVARRLIELGRGTRAGRELSAERAVAQAEEALQMGLAPAQREAVRMALEAPLLVITGGPGTGKTTILRGILRILEGTGLRVRLAAPTGRAAKRMGEATGREASTLHRLLEWNPAEGGFQRHAGRPLEADLVVVDEASMLDLPLAHQLLQAVPPGAGLLLVGDVDQLPSVGPGRVLGDILESGRVPAVRLTEIFRQAEQSRIVWNAHRVNRGELPDLAVPGGGAGDFFFLQEEEPTRVQELLVDLVARRLPARYGFDPREEIQVLTPMHRGPLGAAQLNGLLQQALNPAAAGRDEVVRGGRVFRVGDRVMQLRNNYEKEVFNGDIGRIRAVDLEEQRVLVRLDERSVAYDLGELDELTLAYAITVHKSQGSEYPAVVLPVHTTHYVMLRRNLLYTAITRARRLLVGVGTRKALGVAVRTATGRERFSRLPERLAAAGPPA